MKSFKASLWRQVDRGSLALALGGAIYFSSERVFWSFPRSGDSLADYIGGWLVYAIFAAPLFWLIRQYRVDSFRGFLLAGSAFGWLIEGIVDQTLYGTAEIPFPLTILWTGTAWHGLISVAFGVYAIQQSLHVANPSRILLYCIIYGMFWGIWASGWQAEGPPLLAGMDIFFLHACLCSFFFMGCHLLLARKSSQPVHMDRKSVWVSFALPAIGFVAFVLPHFPWAIGVLPPLLWLVLKGLKRLEATATPGSMGQRRPSAYHVLSFTALPVTATAVYGGLLGRVHDFPVLFATMVITCLLSIWLFCSTFRHLRR